jgi:hypothetical protein
MHKHRRIEQAIKGAGSWRAAPLFQRSYVGSGMSWLAGRWPMSRELRWWPACCGMTTHRLLTDAELEEIERRAQAASLAPWQSFIEGRDHLSGDSFIRIGGLDDDESDLYVPGCRLEEIPASDANLDVGEGMPRHPIHRI